MLVRPDLISVRLIRVLVLILAIATVSSACGKKTPTTPSDPNLVITDLVIGTGLEATNLRTVAVNYTLWLYDASKPDGKGTQVQTSVGGSPFTFTLGNGQVIQGWDLGVPGMKVGGKRRLQVPPNLAYGSSGAGSIPPNATLVFEIDLLGVA